MKLLFDFLPLLLFFGFYKFFNIYVATQVAIIASIIQVIIQKILKKPIEPMQWIGLGILVVFGGLTLYLHDANFIKLKPSILYWSFAAALLGGLLFRKNGIRALMADKITLSTKDWNTLCAAWGVFFLILGFVNLYIAKFYSETIWVNFKVFGALGSTLVFVIAQGFWLAKKEALVDPDPPVIQNNPGHVHEK